MAIIISYFHIFMASAFFMMCLHVRECDTWVVWFKFHETIIRWVLISDGLVRITHPFRVKMYHNKSSSQSWNLKPYFMCWKLETQPKHPKNYTQHPSNKHTELNIFTSKTHSSRIPFKLKNLRLKCIFSWNFHGNRQFFSQLFFWGELLWILKWY